MIPVSLRCPSCGYQWHAATLFHDRGTTPETIAKRCYCPTCEQAPPMIVVTDQGALFETAKGPA